LGPVVIGWALDEGVSILALTSVSILITTASSTLSAVALRKEC